MERSMLKSILSLALVFAWASSVHAESVLIEAEAFSDHGGWTNDTQFTALPKIGSPYLMAHGMGRPVRPATTHVEIPKGGTWRLLVRTKDWVGDWKAPGTPGRFQVAVNGEAVKTVFGTEGAEWHWQDGGTVELPEGRVAVELRDLTGFNGRCDAILLTNEKDLAPPNRDPELRSFRRKLLKLPEEAEDLGEFDLVVVGGGYAGTASAISAARQSLKVALIQDRPVLGGNGSSEVRVWAQGGTMRGKYPHLGEIVEQFADRAPDSPAAPEHFVDDLKEKVVRAEPNITLMLNHYVFAADVDEVSREIRSVTALDCKSGAERKFRGKLFVDCTGHGHLGEFTKAKFEVTEKGHMGTSNMWYWQQSEQDQAWPATPWALALEEGKDFPATHPSKSTAEGEKFFKGEWFWESGFDQHPIDDLEKIRDWNLRAVYGAFTAIKSKPENSKAILQWVSPVGGTRESRRLEGDVVLSREDIVAQREYPDGCVPTTWDIDLHYPKQQYTKKVPDNPFISRAEFGSGVDRKNGYPVPYRCFYSKNVPNLFMAGRCISVTHEALGTVRVMRTCGMMGEVVGKAAFVARKHSASPRDVYEKYWSELAELLEQPGTMRRTGMTEPLVADKQSEKQFPVQGTYPPVAAGGNAAKNGVSEFVGVNKLEGIVIDDSSAKLEGNWTPGAGLAGYVGDCYLYAGAGSEAKATYSFQVPKAGKYEVRLSWAPHENRATKLPVTIEGTSEGAKSVVVNQQKEADLPHGFHSLGVFAFDPAKAAAVVLSAKAANGFVHADCVQVLPVK
jgi:hypothetical protein